MIYPKLFSKYPLISIIVPVYQVEDYLDDCIQSLCSQTYETIEIILIDDGSTDRSSAICDKYAEKDHRIRVHHQKNKGLSGARNEGLRLAEGEYIAFVDSDDCVSPLFIEELYVLLVKYHADISICSYAADWEMLDQEVDRNLTGICLDSKRMLREWHGNRKKIETVVWNKLYKKNVLLDNESPVLFPEGKLHEDVYVSHRIISDSERIVITDRQLYLYRRRTNSIKHSEITEEKVRQNLEAQAVRLEFFYQRGLKMSSRRLAVGMMLHMFLFDWKLLRTGRRPVKKRNLLPYLWKAMI